jgi:hypothetical protein
MRTQEYFKYEITLKKKEVIHRNLLTGTINKNYKKKPQPGSRTDAMRKQC